MSHAPSTFGIMITSSLSPISVTSVVMSSRHQGESRAFTRVQSAVWPRSISLPIFTRPARAGSLFSTVMASSRLPSTMSALAAVSASLPTIFSLLGSKKWIIRDGVTGISLTGSGAPTASGLTKSRGLRKGRPPEGDTAAAGKSIFRAPGHPLSTAFPAARHLAPSRIPDAKATKGSMTTDTDTEHELITDQAGREASGAHAYGRYLEEFEV